jgi:hypothetical protein
MTLDRSYIGYLGFLGIDFLKSVLMYSKGAICLSRLLFKWVFLQCTHQPDIYKSSNNLLVKVNQKFEKLGNCDFI